MLLYVHLQYSSRNNGTLSITSKEFRDHGFRSKATLWQAQRELVSAGWLQLTRQGGMHHCSLYAFTWESIDPSDKYDAGIKAGPLSMLWRDEYAHLRNATTVTSPRPSRPDSQGASSSPRHGPHCPTVRTTLPHDTG